MLAEASAAAAVGTIVTVIGGCNTMYQLRNATILLSFVSTTLCLRQMGGFSCYCSM